MSRLPQLEKYYVRCQRAELQQRWATQLEARQEEGVLEWITAFSDTLVDTWHTQVRLSESQGVKDVPSSETLAPRTSG